MQIYETKTNRKGYSGHTADELTDRLSKVLEDTAIGQQIQKEYEEKHPKTFSKPENWTPAEFDNYQKTNKLISQNPLSGLKNDEKFEVMKAQYQIALIEDVRRRKELGEVIEQKTMNELRSINIEPNQYVWSKEYEKIEEGQE
ncbi:MAG: hypothetical protein ACD_19C00187G0028 [uncultured bacterium]|nr:MAG: hypothetical protein ACD_19C00187G0028 [uncultured bacterium]